MFDERIVFAAPKIAKMYFKNKTMYTIKLYHTILVVVVYKMIIC